MVVDSLLSYCDPGAQGSQVDVLNAAQPGVVVLRITGVGVRLVTFSMSVVLITAGLSVVWLTTRPAGHRGWCWYYGLFRNICVVRLSRAKVNPCNFCSNMF